MVDLEPQVVDEENKSSDEIIHSLHDLVDLLEEPEHLLHTLLLPPQPSADSKNDKDDINNESKHEYNQQIHLLLTTSRHLFTKLENLSALYEKLTNHVTSQDETEDELGDNISNIFPLSGLSELLTYSNTNMESSETISKQHLNELLQCKLDAETIWGQVDLQNNSLIHQVSSNIRKLEKNLNKAGKGNSKMEDYTIKLLDMQDINSDQDQADSDEEKDVEDENASNNNDSDDEDSSQSAENDDDDDEIEDEETRRIRERMERSMGEMDDDFDDDDEDIDNDDADSDIMNIAVGTKKSNEEEDAYDPAREELNDGFFDLHDMEQFADEEEEMLPDEAYGDVDDDETNTENVKNKKEKSKNRGYKFDDDNSSDDDDDDDEFKALESTLQASKSIRRRRYREDDEINALDSLYEDAEEDDDDDANVSALEFFGAPRKPSQAFLDSINKGDDRKKTSKEIKNVSFKELESDVGGDDVDSWDEEDFGSNGANWRDDDSDDNDDESEEDEEEEEELDDSMDKNNTKKHKNVQKSASSSSHAQHSEKLNSFTEQLEKEMLAEKPWQMVGETKGTQRPTNSLLEATPEFEMATKQAPLITEEHTTSIEDMIKSRILNEDWDDVIPRELPDIGLHSRKGELPEVSQEKSKLSLGELYEREYLKKATGYDVDKVEKETEEEKAKNEMRMLFANICSKLDALSNYHFAPRPVADVAEVKTSTTPAIAMEEVLPIHVSNAQASAPEEIYGAKKGRESELRAESEMDQTERKRLRQGKKAARRKARKAKLADEKLISRLQPGLGLNNPYEKRKMREELQMARASGRVIQGEIDKNADFKTSTKFFERMQADVQNSIRGDKTDETSSNKKRKLAK
jgi:U3 small nucleolar RNA-associated protein MPP10